MALRDYISNPNTTNYGRVGGEHNYFANRQVSTPPGPSPTGSSGNPNTTYMGPQSGDPLTTSEDLNRSMAPGLQEFLNNMNSQTGSFSFQDLLNLFSGVPSLNGGTPSQYGPRLSDWGRGVDPVDPSKITTLSQPHIANTPTPLLRNNTQDTILKTLLGLGVGMAGSGAYDLGYAFPRDMSTIKEAGFTPKLDWMDKALIASPFQSSADRINKADWEYTYNAPLEDTRNYEGNVDYSSFLPKEVKSDITREDIGPYPSNTPLSAPIINNPSIESISSTYNNNPQGGAFPSWDTSQSTYPLTGNPFNQSPPGDIRDLRGSDIDVTGGQLPFITPDRTGARDEALLRILEGTGIPYPSQSGRDAGVMNALESTVIPYPGPESRVNYGSPLEAALSQKYGAGRDIGEPVQSMNDIENFGYVPPESRVNTGSPMDAALDTRFGPGQMSDVTSTLRPEDMFQAPPPGQGINTNPYIIDIYNTYGPGVASQLVQQNIQQSNEQSADNNSGFTDNSYGQGNTDTTDREYSDSWGSYQEYKKGGKIKGYAGGGFLSGPGGGMDDMIPASVDGRNLAKLSDGEFVVPADVVSHLGDGSSNAGSKRLYDLIGQVRQEKTGSQDQPGEIQGGLKSLLGKYSDEESSVVQEDFRNSFNRDRAIGNTEMPNKTRVPPPEEGQRRDPVVLAGEDYKLWKEYKDLMNQGKYGTIPGKWRSLLGMERSGFLNLKDFGNMAVEDIGVDEKDFTWQKNMSGSTKEYRGGYKDPQEETDNPYLNTFMNFYRRGI